MYRLEVTINVYEDDTDNIITENSLTTYFHHKSYVLEAVDRLKDKVIKEEDNQ